MAELTLKQKIAQLRSEAHSKAVEKKSNTKMPIYKKGDQERIESRIKAVLDESYWLWYRVSVDTGWRTTDCCELKFSDINFETGEVCITVNKQTRSATARAANATMKKWHTTLMNRAFMSGDATLYMKINEAGYKGIEQFLTEDDIGKFEADVINAVNNADVKRDKRKLSKVALDAIKERMERNIWDDYVFSRHLLKSNRAKNVDGCLTRQSIWKAMKSVFTWFVGKIVGTDKLSAYSTRKTYAYNLLQKAREAGKDGLSIVCDSLGHSSISMTKKYLGLATDAEELQAAMVA